MNEDDRLTLADIAEVRSRVLSMRRRSIYAAGLGGLAFSVLIAVASYFFSIEHKFGFAAFLGGVAIVLFGVPLTVQWWRHWAKILRTLQSTEKEVRAGKVVYGSKVLF